MRADQHIGLLAQIEQLRHADDTRHIVQRPPAHRVPGMRAFATARGRQRQAVRHGIGAVEPLHVGARRHERGQGPLVQAKHVLHHLVLLLLDQAGVHAFFQAGRDFFFGHRTRGGGVNAQQLERARRGARKQLDKGFGRPGQPQHGPRHPAGHGFRVQLADALGHQLAKNNGGEGDHGHHQRSGGDGGRFFGRAPRLQPGSHAVAERGFAHNAVEHANRGDAHLHGRQKLVGVAQQFERCFGPVVASLSQRSQTRAFAAGQRQLRHGKHAVKQCQKNNQQKFHGTGAKMNTWHFT